MEIACSRSATVQTLEQHRPDEALFRKDFQHFLESRLHSYPSRRLQLASRRLQLASRRLLEKTESESILVLCSLYIEASRHVQFTKFSIEFFSA